MKVRFTIMVTQRQLSHDNNEMAETSWSNFCTSEQRWARIGDWFTVELL